jgi:competence protein ComEC
LFARLITVSVLLWTCTISEIQTDRVIIWNVGQGLWVTIVATRSCTHIDMGGEKIDWNKLLAACGRKISNQAVFSHWDLDHISFAEKASKKLSGFCVATPPRGPSTPDKLRIFSRFPHCASVADDVSELKFDPKVKARSRSANDFSRIYAGHSTLFAGDSTAKQERIWSKLVAKFSAKFLILGHHGSHTSTSTRLLNLLPRLRLAIASARKKRYGHPHRSVVENLKNHGVVTLSTEQWNNIVLEL